MVQEKFSYPDSRSTEDSGSQSPPNSKMIAHDMTGTVINSISLL